MLCGTHPPTSGARSQVLRGQVKPVCFLFITPTASPQAQFASAEAACGRFVMSQAGHGATQATRQMSDTQAMVWLGLSLKTLPSQQVPWNVQQNRLDHSLFARTKVGAGMSAPRTAPNEALQG